MLVSCRVDRFQTTRNVLMSRAFKNGTDVLGMDSSLIVREVPIENNSNNKIN